MPDKADRNTKELDNALERLGWSLIKTHGVGRSAMLGGFPDRIGVRDWHICFFEYKSINGKLTPAQKKFRDTYAAPYVILRKPDDAVWFTQEVWPWIVKNCG